MQTINRIRVISIWIFIVPVVALNICLLISVNYHLFENTIFSVDQIGRSGFTIPYIDGGVSISRSARTYPTYLIFKPGMIITAILLIQYWLANNKLFKSIANGEARGNKYFLINAIQYLCDDNSLSHLKTKELSLRMLDKEKIKRNSNCRPVILFTKN